MQLLPGWDNVNAVLADHPDLRRVRLTDVDGMCELGGRFLFIENKSPGKPITGGQAEGFRRLSRYVSPDDGYPGIEVLHVRHIPTNKRGEVWTYDLHHTDVIWYHNGVTTVGWPDEPRPAGPTEGGWQPWPNAYFKEWLVRWRNVGVQLRRERR